MPCANSFDPPTGTNASNGRRFPTALCSFRFPLLRFPLPVFILFALANVVHVQGTMDFSGSTTLMSTFRTFAMYAGAVICLGGLIFAGIRMMSGSLFLVARRHLDPLKAPLYQPSNRTRVHGFVSPLVVLPDSE